MHASRLVELAARLTVADARPEREWDEAEARSVMTRYWVASRARLERWLAQLRCGRSRAGWSADPGACGRAPLGETVVEEFLLADVLARVWLAWLQSACCPRELRPWEGVAVAVLRGHNEFRCRVLRALWAEGQAMSHLAGRLNHIRWRTERWSDLLVESLPPVADSGAARPMFTPVQLPGRVRRRWITSRAVVQAVLRRYPTESACWVTPNADLNRAVGMAVVCGLCGAVDDPFAGLATDLWSLRLETLVDKMITLARPVEVGIPGVSSGPALSS